MIIVIICNIIIVGRSLVKTTVYHPAYYRYDTGTKSDTYWYTIYGTIQFTSSKTDVGTIYSSCSLNGTTIYGTSFYSMSSGPIDEIFYFGTDKNMTYVTGYFHPAHYLHRWGMSGFTDSAVYVNIYA